MIIEATVQTPGIKFKIPDINSKIAGIFSPLFHRAIPKPKLNSEPRKGINLPNFMNFAPIVEPHFPIVDKNLPPFIPAQRVFTAVVIGLKSFGNVFVKNSPTGPKKSDIQSVNARIAIPIAAFLVFNSGTSIIFCFSAALLSLAAAVEVVPKVSFSFFFFTAKTASSKIKTAADLFFDMDRSKNKFLIQDNKPEPKKEPAKMETNHVKKEETKPVKKEEKK